MPNKDNIKEIIERISFIFENASEAAFPTARNKKKSNDKPWFGSCCKTARRKYHLAKKQYNRNNTPTNRANLTECSRQYKKTMNKFIAKHKKTTQQKLRNLQSKNPKDYWKFINSLKNKTATNTPTLEEFYEHFKMLNMAESSENDTQHRFPSSENNASLNARITPDEILRGIKNLKNGKTSGLDNILNEHIKSTSNIFIPVYEKLFNIILDTGIFPEQWSTGCILPIYKSKGDLGDVKNYRPITILSCLGKLFTSIINTRLNDYLEEYMLLAEDQAGFRKQYSTLDHIYSLHALIEILKIKKQKLFACFVDFSSAFDSVWRAGLWHKLVQHNVNGKVFNVIFNMYEDIKSCVSLMGNNSGFFGSFAGVRQGENLSPVLFSIYLNDLGNFLLHNSDNGLKIYGESEDFMIYLRLIVLLYADDTIILANSENDLQAILNKFETYCQTWKLNINNDKTKIVIFGAKKTDSFNFKLNGKNVQITDKYKYLGIYFSQSRSFLTARKHIVEQAKKAMYLLFYRIHNLNLPVDLQLKLFDHTVLPILTYACEIWGFEKLDMLEQIHTDFLRKITKSKKSTPLYMLYAELGRFPLEIIIKSRIIGFWNKIILGKNTKTSYLLYQVLRTMDHSCTKWISNVKNILAHTGNNNIWINQNDIQSLSINQIIKRTLIDQFLQEWASKLNNSTKGRNYSIFKDNTDLENYFILLPKHLYLNMVKFRTCNHKLPVETGRWNGIDYADRICRLCDKQTIGDEFHYILECSFFQSVRQRLIPQRYYTRPNILKYHDLLNLQDETNLCNLSKLMSLIMSHFRNTN